MSMLYACGLQFILSFVVIGDIDYFMHILLGTPLHIDKPLVWGYIIFWAIFEYIVFYRNERYIEIFDEYDRQSDTPTMKSKLKHARIFNFSLLALEILSLFVVDYCNHHK
jgi:hypothetical protein